MFVSHEMLVLDYERALLRLNEDQLYLLSAHQVWIGDRTRQLDGAHVGLAALLANPIGVKIGPTTTPDMAVELVQTLDPRRVDGRVTLVSRMGSDKVRDLLPPIVDAVTRSGHRVVWQCDPMHGNTEESPHRAQDPPLRPDHGRGRGLLRGARQVRDAPRRHPRRALGRGRHRASGGAENIEHHHLNSRYETACDPRLNTQQSLELAFLVVDMLRRTGKSH